MRGLRAAVIVWALAIPIILFTGKSNASFLLHRSELTKRTVFPLVSCVSTPTNNIYLVSVLWNSDDGTWLRIGYYGLCLVSSTTSACATVTGRTSTSIAKKWGTTTTDDIAGIESALNLQGEVFVAFMTAGGIDWLFSVVLATAVVLQSGRANRGLKAAAKVTAISTAMLMFASAWATNSAAKALSVAAGGSSVKQGTLLIALQWIAAILSFFHAWAVTNVVDAEDIAKTSSRISYA